MAERMTQSDRRGRGCGSRHCPRGWCHGSIRDPAPPSKDSAAPDSETPRMMKTPSMKRALAPGLCLALAAWATPGAAQDPDRDEFYWLGEINKASLVINTE